MRYLGLDEAGRGSVLGPLVVGGFLFEGEDPESLRGAGAADSKALTAKARGIAREKLVALGHGEVVAIAATTIDEGNLNTLEVEAFLKLVAQLKPDRVYLDAPVNPAGIPRFKAMLQDRSGVSDWVVEPKADVTYAVVGAASIFAKVARDAAVDGLGAGSGYPSDPETRFHIASLLKKEAPLPDYVRTRWGTIQSLRQQTLFGV